MIVLVVREYVEEKNKTILLAVDISSSMQFGSPLLHTKEENVQQLASVLALVANYAQDRVGLILFSDTVECFVPPKQGAHHARYIMEMIFSHKARGKKTSLNVVRDL